MAKVKRTAKRASVRREDELSRERIVDAAIELMDELGEEGLTFRALAAWLATGPGAIYWHITNKEELLAEASEVIVARALGDVHAPAAPRKAIVSIAMAMFETIDMHPWVGTELVRSPPPRAMLQLFERIGRQVQALRVPEDAQFTAATVLGSYIISESRQNAANATRREPRPDRADFLATVAAQWTKLDAEEFPFIRHVAKQLREHDDRAEFVAGIDLILAGIAGGSRKAR